jgi:GT2 family glycosyltransferase
MGTAVREKTLPPVSVVTPAPGCPTTGSRESPRVDVVILTWNDEELLAVAVASALGSRGVDVKVTIVDNGSDPPAEAVPDPRVNILRNAVNLGVAPGRAQGIAAGRADLVLLLDSDARLEPDALAAMVRVLDADPSVGLVGPVFADQLPEASGGRAPTFAVKAARGLGRRDDYEPGTVGLDGHHDVDFVIGACQLVRRTAYLAVGGLDTTIFYGPEDVDLCLRIQKGGWRVRQLEGVGCHHPPRRRNRRLLSRRGLKHAHQIGRHLLRSHRRRSSRPVRRVV